MKWSKEIPKEAGTYWFYGYRFGRVSCGNPQNPEWGVLKVRNTAQAGRMMYVMDGNFVDFRAVEDARFAPLELPDFPDIGPEPAEGETDAND